MSMEEVDEIIIATLKKIGCNIEPDVVSLHHFSPAMMVEACVRCMKTINTDFACPTSLPEAMSAKYRMCTTLATACQELGYTAEIGYQTFLYPNIKDWRRLLMFMLEKLPREETKISDEPLGSSALLNRTIVATLKSLLEAPWMPPLMRKRKLPVLKCSQWTQRTGGCAHGFHTVDVQCPIGVTDLSKRIPKDLRNYYSQQLPYLVSQPPIADDLAASVLEKNAVEYTAQVEWENEWNQMGLASRLSEHDYQLRKKQRLQKKLAEQLKQGVQWSQSGKLHSTGRSASDFEEFLAGFADKSYLQGKGSRFQHTEKLQFTKEEDIVTAPIPDGPAKPTEEELAQQREDEVNSLEATLAELTNQVEKMQMDIKKFSTNMQQVKEMTTSIEEETSKLESEYETQKKTYDLLPNAEENIAKLQGLVTTTSTKLAKLAAQWEEHRTPLVNRYRELKATDTLVSQQVTELLEELQLIRQEMKQVADAAKHKDDLHKQLVAEYERMNKDLNRSAYTKRIMEIVGNIRKQQADIDKVLVDTKLVQKEINSLSGKLERIFFVTDEQIFKDAKKDEARRTAYKYLAHLRENCSDVVEAIKETGQIKREIKDLEEQIESESSKRIADNLQKITDDYQQVKQENQQLVKQLKS